jgi:hypothetical protein
MAKNGQKWPKMAKNGPQSRNGVKKGPKIDKLDPNKTQSKILAKPPAYLKKSIIYR